MVRANEFAHMHPKSVNHPKLLSSASAVALILVATIAVCPVRAANSDSKPVPAAIATTVSVWLAAWDAGDWTACWNGFSPAGQANMRLDKWSSHARSSQEILGKLQSRKFIGVEKTVLRGEVVRAVFDSIYAHRGLMSEGVYVEKQPDGSWKVSAHWTKAKTAPWPDGEFN
jgi:hypothetical protein